MGQEPQQIRQNIEATRTDMGVALDEIEDRVSPSRVVARQQQRMRDRWHGVRIRVMGSYDEAAMQSRSARQHGSSQVDDLKGSAEDAKDAAAQAPQQVLEQTQGRPLVAGAVAFGLGVLAASLFPASQEEKRAVETLQDRSEGVKQDLKESANKVGSEVADAAKDATQQLTDQANESTERVKDEAQHQTEQVRQEAAARTEDVKSDAQSSTDEVKDHTRSATQSVRDSGTSQG